MENRTQIISAKKNKHIKIGIIPGHFATNHSHINYYVDLNAIKRSFRMSKETAREIAEKYSSAAIDTIICLEGTQVLGAFVAQELAENGVHSINSGKDIDILTPELNSNNQMIFRDDSQKKIWGKQILLLISSASTGWTIDRCVQCLDYYNGNLAGVTAIFSAIKSVGEIPVNAVFTPDDISDYATYASSECPMCRNKQKVDAIVNAYGYSKI